MSRPKAGGIEWFTFAPGSREARGWLRIDMSPGALRASFVARSDRRSRLVRLAGPDGALTEAGLVYADLWWAADPAPDSAPDLHLSWPDDPSVPVGFAEVSDVLRLAEDAEAQRAVRAFFDALPDLGRPPGSRNRARLRLIAEVRDRPDMTRDEIDDRAVGLGVWTDALGDTENVRKRVHRLRTDAARQ